MGLLSRNIRIHINKYIFSDMQSWSLNVWSITYITVHRRCLTRSCWHSRTFTNMLCSCVTMIKIPTPWTGPLPCVLTPGLGRRRRIATLWSLWNVWAYCRMKCLILMVTRTGFVCKCGYGYNDNLILFFVAMVTTNNVYVCGYGSKKRFVWGVLPYKT